MGIVAGLLMGLLIALPYSTPWLDPPPLWDFVLTFLLAGSVYGALLFLLAWAAWRRSLRLQRSPNVFVFLLVGAFLASAVLVAVKLLPHGTWVAVQTPPEPIKSLAGPDCLRIPNSSHVLAYAEAASGGRLALLDPDDGLGGHLQWTLAATVDASTSNSASRRDRSLCRGHSLPSKLFNRPPSLPGVIQSSLSMARLGADGAGREEIVLLSDGTVWMWHRITAGLIELLSLAATWFLGLILGLAAWALVPKPIGRATSRSMGG